MRIVMLQKLRLPENLFLCGFFGIVGLQACVFCYHRHELTGRALLVDQFLLSVLVAYWVMRDSARHDIRRPFVFGLLLYLIWPILAPWHVFKTRGWRGFATLGIFLLLYLLAFAVPDLVFASGGWDPKK